MRALTQEGIYGTSTGRVSEDKAVRNYTQAAVYLYDRLLAPLESKVKLTKELIIIPDGVLGYVPFEALLTQQPANGDLGRFAKYAYLLRDHQISYNYSATLLREMKQKTIRPETAQQVLAMAPFFLGNADTLVAYVDSTEIISNNRDSLAPLDYSGQEVKNIVSLCQGTPFYGQAASLEQFKILAPQYRILHLSTHGKADDRVGDYAYLAFGMPDAEGVFDKLYARDLYNMQLNAELVVLSACEAGIGRLRRGEGIVSLARAFAYAGAKSLVTTLWSVNDAKTQELMVEFYRQLEKGKTKDAALQAAKLRYLQKNNNNAASNPFFWAGLIAIGDMSAVRN